ncbi:MAG: exodeoxyribonuclease VII large subunit, partial [Candidatus Thiodiazotropha sp. 4PDIVS1]
QQNINLIERLHRAIRQRMVQYETRLNQIGRDLHNLSPLNTLGRGYAIISRPSDGAIVTHSSEVNVGDQLQTRLQQGKLVCQVLDKED